MFIYKYVEYNSVLCGMSIFPLCRVGKMQITAYLSNGGGGCGTIFRQGALIQHNAEQSCIAQDQLIQRGGRVLSLCSIFIILIQRLSFMCLA